MDIFETLGINEEKIPKGYGHGIPKEIVKAADVELRKKVLINETVKKEPKTQVEIIQEMDSKITFLNQSTKPAPVPAPIPTKNSYPTSKEFTEFHNDFTFYRTPLKFSIKDDVLTITNQTPNGKPLTIGMYSILEFLGDKFNAPVMENIDFKKGYKTLPDLIEFDKKIKAKWWDFRTFFTDMYEISVPRLEQECRNYHEIMSWPLNLRIEFLEFERTLVSQKIINGILEGLKERDAQLEQIRKDYLTKYENEKTLHRTEFEKWKKDTQKYNIILEQLKTRNDNLSTKLESVTTENSGYYNKVQDAEKKAEKAEMELTNSKIKVAEAEKKVIKYEVDPWMQDSNSDAERPVFFNKVTGEIISYPVDFKKSYHLNRKEGDVMVYVNEKGKEFNVPETLVIRKTKASSVVIDDKKVGVEKDENALTSRQQKIFDAISECDEPLTVVEISEITRIAPNHINEDKKALLENGLIIEDFSPEENVHKYSPS